MNSWSRFMNKALLVLTLWAANAVPTPAAGENPLVKMPTGDAAWVVEISYPKANAAPGSSNPKEDTTPTRTVRPAKAEVTSIAGIMRSEITWTDGNKTQVWRKVKAGYTIVESPKSLALRVYPEYDNAEIGEALLPMGIDSFNWISDKYADGKKPFKR